MRIKRFRLWIAKIKDKIRIFREYYGWYYPSLNTLMSKKKDLIELRSAMFREDNKVKYSYYLGQVDLINTLLEVWYGIRNPKSKRDI